LSSPPHEEDAFASAVAGQLQPNGLTLVVMMGMGAIGCGCVAG